MDTLAKDLRFAIRVLIKNPGFTLIAVLALALGIGANTSIFSVVNAVLIRPLPFEEPEKLVVLWGNVKRQVVERRGASAADYLDWRAQSKSYTDMAAYWASTFTYYAEDEPERLQGETVASGYFEILGIKPVLGRVFSPEADKPGASPGAIISHSLWLRRFGGKSDLLDKSIRLDGRPVPIIGVMPAGFKGIGDQADIWVPIGPGVRPQDLTDRGSRWFAAVARLKPGVSREQAQAEITQISAALERAYPATNEKRSVEVALLNDELLGNIRPALLVILAAVGLVLLIACANVANLLLAQAEKRQREVAIRLALGASKSRLIRQLITEGMLLSIAGAALGVVLSRWGVDALLAASPVTFPTFATVKLDATVVLFTLGVSIVTGVLLGLAPAFHSTMSRLHDTLKEASGRSSGGSARQRFRNGLVVAEVALAVVLLIGAGLLIRSFRHLAALDPGFNPENLLTLRIGLPRLPAPAPGETQPPSQQAATTARLVLEKLQALPSVKSASLGSDLPLSNEGGAMFYAAEGQPPVDAQNRPRAYVHRVTPGFFATMGIPMRAGRDFSVSDADGVVIVSENVVKRFWPGQDPIGKRIKPGSLESRGPWFEIVGVVGETNYRALPQNPTADPDTFFPFAPQARQFAIFLRTGMDPTTLTAAVRDELKQIDRTIVIYNVAPMTERVGTQMARARFTSWLMGIFSTGALLLAVIGIYGVMSYAVTRRTQEIGIRMALGASARDVLRMVVRNGILLVLGGVGIGFALAIGLTRLLERLLFGVQPTDPATFFGVAAVLIAVALFAAYLPARRATRIDPMTALRYE
jgi:putative ABC transport system permease protein